MNDARAKRPPPGPPPTIGYLREQGVTRFRVSCSSINCITARVPTTAESITSSRGSRLRGVESNNRHWTSAQLENHNESRT